MEIPPVLPPLPEEFIKELEENSELTTAFFALTQEQQKRYILYFSSLKQPEARTAGIEKCRERILEGKGLDECT